MESSQTAWSQHHPELSKSWCIYRMTTSLSCCYGRYRPSWLKRISIILSFSKAKCLILASGCGGTGTWKILGTRGQLTAHAQNSCQVLQHALPSKAQQNQTVTPWFFWRQGSCPTHHFRGLKNQELLSHAVTSFQILQLWAFDFTTLYLKPVCQPPCMRSITSLCSVHATYQGIKQPKVTNMHPLQM